MNFHPDLSKISQITDNIFLSGIYPMELDPIVIKKLGIKYILSCLSREYVSEAHDKVLIDSPGTIILYLPYDDVISQNLWCQNTNKINIVKYVNSTNEYNKLSNLIGQYDKKPMIEVGYHFINHAVSSGDKVLVHCMAGISRSVSTLTYYLMKKHNLNYFDTINHIRSRRSIANPNDCFKVQLQNYQNKREKFLETDAKKIVDHFVYGCER